MLPPIANRFVAGESAAEAVARARTLNDRDVKAIVNLLGEHYRERGPADEDTDAYLDLVTDLSAGDVDACISLKPSQIGLDVGAAVFEENLGRIVDAAVEEDVFVWIDMEDHTTTDATLDAYEKYVTEHEGGVGVCVQANLRRTEEDLTRLAPLPGKVRLVKGAYDPPKEIAYQSRERVNIVYENCLEYMFREFDGGIAVGSHDPAVISRAKELHEEHGTDFEIQMLMGVREDAQFELANEGYEVYQYIPYGDRWAQYFYRRVMERKENLLFALRAVLGR